VLYLLGANLDLRASEGNWWMKAFPLQAVPQSSRFGLGKGATR
jgi:hypothetical protein